jgi:hypothetical protein
MKLSMLFLGPCLIALAWSQALAQRGLSPEEWDALQRGEIVRECAREEGTQGKGAGVGLFDAPVDIVWKVLVELEYYDEIMPQTTASVLLDEATKERVIRLGAVPAQEVEKLFIENRSGFVLHDPEDPNRFTVYSYQKNHFPWPLNDRWCLLEIRHDSSTYTQTWRYLAGNMKNDFGTWRLEPFRENQTLGWLDIHVDMGIPATGPFMKYAMSLTMPDTFNAFRQRARELVAEKEPGCPPKHKPEGGKL